MLEFNVRISTIKFHGKTYLRDLDRALSKLVREAARDWLIAVLNHISGAPHTVGDSFPIQTGEAKGSFIPLGRRLDVPIPITPAIDSRYKDGRHRPNNASQGAAQSTFSLPGSARGAGAVQPTYSFYFNTLVRHFLKNETTSGDKNVVSDTPWHSFEAGNDAFRRTFVAGQKLMPRINDYAYYSSEDGINI